MTLKRTVLIEGIFLLVLSFVALGEAIHLISTVDPHAVIDAVGPGYYILFLGLALMATGTLHLIVNYGKGVAAAKVEVDMDLRKRMISMVLTLALYIFIIDFLGYLISTVIFFLLEFRVVGIKSWRSGIILSIVLTAVCYIVFVKYCNIVFPRGIFF